MIAAVLLAVVALSSADPNNPRNVLARFYSDFAQLYLSAPPLEPSSLNSDGQESTQRYQFLFTEQQYLKISEESLTMLYTNVIDRTITYHPMPNFEVKGTRYFYRRDPKQEEPVEIELVNPQDRLFRQVQEPNRYFYLSSYDNLEYTTSVPVMPYYEVTFTCNSSFSKDVQTQPPLLSYIDKSFQWTPRYLLDLPMFGTGKRHEMCAYADIRNNGEDTFVVRGTELITGDTKLIQKPVDYTRTAYDDTRMYTYASPYTSITTFTRASGEQASGTYVYQLETPSILLPPRSMKSIKFSETNVTVVPFLYYSSVFSTLNSNGKLFKAYNITSLSTYLPDGHLRLREEGRFIGEISLPDLAVGETYTMTFGYDADVSYRRQVKMVQGTEDGDSVTYNVQYIFENYKPTRDVRLYFTESFSTFTYFEVKDISTSSDDNKLPDLMSYGTELRGYMMIPRERGQKMISYNLTTYKVKPTVLVVKQ
jgi:hypothetical protein